MSEQNPHSNPADDRPAGLAPKPGWAMTLRERRRAVLKEAGLEPKRRWPWVLGFLVVAGGGVMLTAPLLSSPETPEQLPPAEQTAPVMQIHPLDVYEVRVQTLQDTLRVAASIQPRRSVQLNSEVAGKVETVAVRLGDIVKAGEVLVTMDVETLQSQLAQQKATLEANRAQVALAESQLQRSEHLAKRGLATATVLETDGSNMAVQRANLAAQRATVEAAEINLRNATVIAPFDGVVAKREVEPGQLVANGAALLQIVDSSMMSLAAAVPVSASKAIKVGQVVDFTVEGLGGEAFAGQVEGISPTTIAGTRSTPINILIDNSDERLRGGMFANGRIIVDEQDQALAVPLTAVHTDAEGSFVLVIAAGTLERRPVTAGRTWASDTLVQITEGLVAGDLVVARPLSNLAAGAAVRVAEI